MFAHSHDEPMHLVVHLHQGCAMGSTHGRWRMSGAANTGFQMGGQRCGSILLFAGDRSQPTLKQGPNVLVICARPKNAVAVENAARVSIDNENRMISRIKQNGVCCLRAHAIQAEKFIAKLIGRPREELIQRQTSDAESANRMREEMRAQSLGNKGVWR